MELFPKAIVVVSLCVWFLTACAGGDVQKVNNVPASNAAGNVSNSSAAMPTPSNKFSAEDIAKLKWIEGDWRGMDGAKPFYERYKLEGTTLVVDSIKDETFKKVEETGKFELVNGEFGKTDGDQRSAASEITEKSIQFVPAPGSKGNMFRFESVDANTWHAILEMPSNPDPERRRKIYVMERWPKK